MTGSKKAPRVKLFEQKTATKEMGNHILTITNLDGVMISNSNAKRIERELKVISSMVT